MDIRHLTYFVQVARERSFTKASNTLHVSQPALSKMIKNLEDELGFQLIDRSEKNFTLTDVGISFLNESERMVEGFNTLLESMYDTVNLKRGNVKVGIPPVIGSAFFPTVIAGFRKKHPGIEIHMIEDGAKTVASKVYEGVIDIGLVIQPINDTKFDVIPIIEDKNVLIVHKDHPLANRNQVSFIDLKDELFVLLNESFMLHDYIISACKDAGFEPIINFKSSQWDFITEMVSLNQGISILPRLIVKKINNPLIKQIPIAEASSSWRIAIILKKGKYVSYAMKAFVEYVENCFK